MVPLESSDVIFMKCKGTTLPNPTVREICGHFFLDTMNKEVKRQEDYVYVKPLVWNIVFVDCQMYFPTGLPHINFVLGKYCIFVLF